MSNSERSIRLCKSQLIIQGSLPGRPVAAAAAAPVVVAAVAGPELDGPYLAPSVHTEKRGRCCAKNK